MPPSPRPTGHLESLTAPPSVAGEHCSSNPITPRFSATSERHWSTRVQLHTAIGHFRDALRLRPNFADAHNNLGNALRLTGRQARRTGAFPRSRATRPDGVQGLDVTLGGCSWSKANLRRRWNTASRLSASAPTPPRLEITLAMSSTCLASSTRLRPASGEAIRLDPLLASAHAGLGAVLEETRATSRGQDITPRGAATRNPGTPVPWLDWPPGCGPSFPQADLAMIEELLADPDLPPEQRWPLQFGLAHSLDARGEFHRAAALTRPGQRPPANRVSESGDGAMTPVRIAGSSIGSSRCSCPRSSHG